MNTAKLQQYIDDHWDKSIIPALQEYIRIPSRSPSFDVKWQLHGYIEQAVQLLQKWARQQSINNLSVEVVRLANRTPLIFIEVAGAIDKTVLLYGHLDKQPEMEGWDADKGPWCPLLLDNKLYGRGGADDGYAIFCALTAIAALQKQDIPHPQCIIIIEACEESGSYDLLPYLDYLKHKLVPPDLVICLDSGCMDYEHLWCTTSLRGVTSGTLNIEVLREGVHSGLASGIAASCFRILRLLLSRLEDEKTGEILLQELQVKIPTNRIEEAKKCAAALKDNFLKAFPFVEGVQPVTANLNELILNQTWRPALTVTGISGLANIENAGNVLRPKIAAKLSFRLPPTCDEMIASRKIKEILEKDPPYNAKVSYETDAPGAGWNAPKTADWLFRAANEASNLFYQGPAQFFGEGGTIPFMGLLGRQFPQAQFLIVGVLGPKSNAHGPNEFLHIPMAKKLTACVSYVIASLT